MSRSLHDDLIEKVAFPVELRRDRSHYLVYVTPLAVDLLVAHHFARRKSDGLWLTGSGKDYRFFNFQEDDHAFAVSDFEYRFLIEIREKRTLFRFFSPPFGGLIPYEVTGTMIEATRFDDSFELAYLTFFDDKNLYGSRTAKRAGGTQRIFATHGSYPQGGLNVQNLYDSGTFDASRIKKIDEVKCFRMMTPQGSFRPLGGLEEDLRNSSLGILKRISARME